jgi:LysM repeat protein
MLFISTLVLSAEAADKAYAQPSEKKASQTKKSKNLPKKITIKSGDSLSKIAKKHGSTYPRIFYANKSIKDPDVIYPGKKIRIPAPSEKLKKRPLQKPVQSAPVRQTQSPARSYTPSQVTAPAPAPAPSYSNSGGVWDRLAQCESGGNWSINTGNGYYGGLQFSASSWRAAGGSGLPHQASRGEQIARAKVLQSRQGWGAWPACTAKLGIR